MGNSEKYTTHSYEAKGVLGDWAIEQLWKYNSPSYKATSALQKVEVHFLELPNHLIAQIHLCFTKMRYVFFRVAQLPNLPKPLLYKQKRCIFSSCPIAQKPKATSALQKGELYFSKLPNRPITQSICKAEVALGDWATLKNIPLLFIKQKGLWAIGQLGNSEKYTSHSYEAKEVLGDWAIGQL